MGLLSFFQLHPFNKVLNLCRKFSSKHCHIAMVFVCVCAWFFFLSLQIVTDFVGRLKMLLKKTQPLPSAIPSHLRCPELWNCGNLPGILHCKEDLAG